MSNLCSAKRTKYITVKNLAEELETTVQQIYKILKEPAMENVSVKIGPAAVRVKYDEFFNVLEQIYR